MENKLYIIGIKRPLKELVNHFELINFLEEKYVEYFNFWENIVFIEYNQDTHNYLVKENVNNKIQYYEYEQEKELFRHMDKHNIKFINDNNPMGAIFQNYSIAYLTIVRWVADVAWTRELYFNLLEG